MVHISRLSDKRVEKVEDVVNIGDTVTVKVLDVDKMGKISLSMKAVEENAEPEPIEEKVAAQYSSGRSVGTSLGDLLKGLKL